MLLCCLTKDLRKMYPTHAVMLFDKRFEIITLCMLFKNKSEELRPAIARNLVSLSGHVEIAVYV